MDSDSDSNGSHISATPPRHSTPSPPPPPLPPPAPAARTTLLSSIKSRSKFKATATSTPISISRPILKPKPSSKSSRPAKIPDPKQPLEENPPQFSIPPPDLSQLPFHIHRSTHGSSSFSYSSNDSVAILLPGGRLVSKFASFSKTRKEKLNFEPIESDQNDPLFSTPQPKAELGDNNVVPQETGNEGVNLSKTVKKHPNCIGGSVFSSSSAYSASLLSAKRVKGGSEGNFVKLNINGYGRKKFKFKGRRSNFGSSSSGRQRFSKGRKRESGVGDEGNREESELCDEEGLVVEIKQTEKRLDFDTGTIEEAVMRVRNEASDENLVRLLKLTHGYDSFRDGQLEAIKMVLSGKSTMLVLPTGAGKSLCYQLPALVLPGVTLVVSPLVALMIDQLKHLPPAIPGGLLCSIQTPEEASENLKLLQNQALKVLFVSPERLLNAEFTSIFSGSSLLSLVVIDEAHCVSEWSHNFRPSYMRLRASMLHAKLDAKCILAMTATATSKTLRDVMHALEIPARNLIQAAKMRENLQLSVSMTRSSLYNARMKDLMTLLKSTPFVEIKSIIIYCKFQSETDLISKYLCDNNISAKSYNSSVPAKDRSRIQELFCLNKIRVVVATVAFGMGLDKRDIGAVIHYSLPESLEEYVQEIGRAGRDGRLSYCHLFFDEAPYFKMRSLMHSEGVDEYAVNKFLCQVFSYGTNSSGEICSLIKESASRKFDIKEEVMLTILTQLELGEVQYLNLLPEIKVNCTLNFHQTSPALLATKDIVVAAILKKSELKDGQYVFDIPSIANSIRLQAIDLSNHLQSLKLKGEITYELKDQAYCYTIMDVPTDICSLAATITKWLSEVEISKVRKIDAMFNAAVFAVKECSKVDGCHDHQHTPCLQRKISEYFNLDNDVDIPNKMGENSRFLRADIKVFLQSHSQAKFTPRAVARIMHGLASPAFPSMTWSKTHFWGRYMQIDFKVIMEAAKAELMNFVSQSAV